MKDRDPPAPLPQVSAVPLDTCQGLSTGPGTGDKAVSKTHTVPSGLWSGGGRDSARTGSPWPSPWSQSCLEQWGCERGRDRWGQGSTEPEPQEAAHRQRAAEPWAGLHPGVSWALGLEARSPPCTGAGLLQLMRAGRPLGSRGLLFLGPHTSSLPLPCLPLEAKWLMGDPKASRVYRFCPQDSGGRAQLDPQGCAQ